MTDMEALGWLAEQAAKQADDMLAQVGIETQAHEFQEVARAIYRVLRYRPITADTMALIHRRTNAHSTDPT